MVSLLLLNHVARCSGFVSSLSSILRPSPFLCLHTSSVQFTAMLYSVLPVRSAPLHIRVCDARVVFRQRQGALLLLTSSSSWGPTVRTTLYCSQCWDVSSSSVQSITEHSSDNVTCRITLFPMPSPPVIQGGVLFMACHRFVAVGFHLL